MSGGIWRYTSARTRRGLVLAWTALFVLSLGLQYLSFMAPQGVLAVHDDGLFELDGNVANDGVPGDDWANVYAGTSSADNTFFQADPVNDPSDDTFTGGSTKDDIDFPLWKWKFAKASQAKNDITHAFAASYTDPGSGDLIAYFGLSKWEADGNNYAGFWFLQDTNGPIGDGNPPGSPFSGVHHVGDVLVLANYTNGGAIADFDIFRWVGTGGDANAAGTLDTYATGVPCTGGAGDEACGAANSANVTTPWPYSGRDSNGNPLPADTMAPGTFFEGGLNLTALNLDQACFTGFIAETRSSQSVDASLSDFVGGQFSFCRPPEIATQVLDEGGLSLGSLGTINVGESVQDSAVVGGSLGDAAGTVDFFLCGPSQSAPDCSTGGTAAGSDTLVGGEAYSDLFTADSPSDVGFYCYRAEYTPAAGSKYLADEHTNQTTECFQVLPAQVTISKTAVPTGPVDAGDQIGFTLSWGNSGPGTATGVVVTDDLPTTAGLDWGISGFTGSGSTCVIEGAVGAEVLTCNVGSIPGNTATHGTVTVVSATTVDSCGVIENQGDITSGNDGSANASASVTVECPPPDLTIVKTPDDQTVDAGTPITFAITVSNSDAPGTNPAIGVQLEDALPDGVDWELVAGYDGECSISPDVATAGQVLTCSFGDLAAGESASVSVTAATSFVACATYDNQAATAWATNHDEVSDPGLITCEAPVLSIVKTADAETVNAGDDIGFEIVVSNAGPGTAKSVVLNDPLPEGVTWTVDGGADAADCDPITDGDLHCEFGDLAAGESATVHVGATTSAQACSLYDNTATASATNHPDVSDRAVIDCDTGDIDLTKSADDESVVAGDPIGFTVTVANTGDGAAYGVLVTDPLPGGAGVTWVESPDIEGWTITGEPGAQVLTFESEVLGPGMFSTVHVTAQTDREDCGEYDNTATVTTTNDGSDEALATTAVVCPVLTLDKENDAPIETIDLGDGTTIDLPTADEGDTVTYTLDYTLVDGPVTDGVLTDVLPAGVEYVDGTAQGNDEFSFVSYDAATRTLLWEAGTVTKNGTVTYDVVVQDGAAELAQPLVNVAEISSNETPPDGAESDVFVNEPPQELTPPPTDTFVEAPQGGSSLGLTLMLILLLVAGAALLTGFLTPVPARVRRDRRDGR